MNTVSAERETEWEMDAVADQSPGWKTGGSLRGLAWAALVLDLVGARVATRHRLLGEPFGLPTPGRVDTYRRAWTGGVGSAPMTATSERYAKLAGQMADRIAAVPADGWDAATPCEGWTARDLLDHLIDSPSHFFGRVGTRPAPARPRPRARTRWGRSGR